MFERFTDRARNVVVLAQEEARMLDHDYIGAEHILLGLINESQGRFSNSRYARRYSLATTTSAPSTSCLASSARARGWPWRCSSAWTPT